MEKIIIQAIHFVEDNILKNISVKDVSQHVHVSQFYLHRIFKVFCGVTITEYIRNRRLSLAGLDVMKNEETLLHLALKYQYNSQEGFQKAFYRFHNVNPQKARHGNAVLKTYHPLKIQIKFEGGRSMDYRIVKQEPFTLLCVKKAFPNSIIEEENNHDIPDYWTEHIQKGTIKELLQYAEDKTVYGPCDAVSKDSDSFYYGIGVQYKGEPIDDFDLWHVNHPLYAVFQCQTKDDMGSTWKKIFEEFLPNSDYELADATDLEVYPDDDKDYFCEIWVPIQ
jgi:AraC family transcriptional regulator